MKKNILPIVFFTVVTLLFSSLIFTPKVGSAASDHVVISEIQVGAGNNDFVELYNPTDSDIDLEGWKLSKKVTTESSLVASMSGTIKAHGFFLISNDSGSASEEADLLYGSSIANNNTILLYSDNGTTLIDKVGLGTSTEGETTPVVNPADGESIERKAFPGSTTNSMSAGEDVDKGNCEDSNNNFNDFILRSVPEPQNSQSPIEICEADEPTPTPTATATATATPTLTPSASPTLEPTAAPTITATPTLTPTQSPSPTPTITLAPTPTSTSIPSASPTSTSNTGNVGFWGLRFCRVDYSDFSLGSLKIKRPRVTCQFPLQFFMGWW